MYFLHERLNHATDIPAEGEGRGGGEENFFFLAQHPAKNLVLSPPPPLRPRVRVDTRIYISSRSFAERKVQKWEGEGGGGHGGDAEAITRRAGENAGRHRQSEIRKWPR